MKWKGDWALVGTWRSLRFHVAILWPVAQSVGRDCKDQRSWGRSSQLWDLPLLRRNCTHVRETEERQRASSQLLWVLLCDISLVELGNCLYVTMEIMNESEGMSLRAGVCNEEFSLLDMKKQIVFLDYSRAPNARPSLGP